MFIKANPLFYKCQTPLHAGSGSDLGWIDLPIQRERHTLFPKIESSSLKGAIREVFSGNESEIQIAGIKVQVNDKRYVNLVFGHEDGDTNAGAIGLTDVRLLLFPVKSFRGIFGLITCPAVLQRLSEELKNIAKFPFLEQMDFDNLRNNVVNKNLCIGNKLRLEDFEITVKVEDSDCLKLADALSNLTGFEQIKNKLIVVDNDIFSFFTQRSTEIITRIKIGANGTVEHGPFNEEYLPMESILYNHVLASRVFRKEESSKLAFAIGSEESLDESDKVLDYFHKGLKKVIQLGGNATLAKGILKINVAPISN